MLYRILTAKTQDINILVILSGTAVDNSLWHCLLWKHQLFKAVASTTKKYIFTYQPFERCEQYGNDRRCSGDSVESKLLIIN